MSLRRALYKAARIAGDVESAAKAQSHKRAGRKNAHRKVGGFLRKLLKGIDNK